jgi:hypothetical protein
MIGPKGRECSNGRQTMAPSPILMQSPLQTMWMRLTNVLIAKLESSVGQENSLLRAYHRQAGSNVRKEHDRPMARRPQVDEA